MQKWSNYARRQKKRKMKITADLYQEAQDSDIPIMSLSIPKSGSMCIQSNDRQCYIGIDSNILRSHIQERVHLAHELGHCKTGSFYNRYASVDIRQKHENRADKWAIKKLVPKDELDTMVQDGHTEIWDLADRFGVTEDFMRKAICLYTNGNLAPEFYGR